MLKSKGALLAFLAVCVGPFLALPAQAGADKTGFYIAGFAGGSLPSDQDAEIPPYDIESRLASHPGSGVTLNNLGNEKRVPEISKSFVAGAAVGYNVLRFLRIEEEFSYRRHRVSDAPISSLGGIIFDAEDNPQTSYAGFQSRLSSSDLAVMTFMTNVYYDWHNSTPFVPYVMVGGGLARMSLDGGSVSITFPGGPYATDLWSNASALALAFQLGAGTSYPLTSSVDLTMGYRFLRTGTAEFSPQAYSTALTNALFRGDIGMRYMTHEIVAGMRYNF